MPISFCVNPCVSPSAPRWWEVLAATPYAEVQRHKLQSASASFTSLVVNGVRSGMKKDPHADFPYRIIKTEPPQLVLSVAETEKDILQSWAALLRYFFGKSPGEIQTTEWMSVGARIVEKESKQSTGSLDGGEGWVDVPTSSRAAPPPRRHREAEAVLENFGAVLEPFVPLASHVQHTIGWGDPYRSVACLIIVWNAWSRDFLVELALLTLAGTLGYLHWRPPQGRPADRVQLALDAIGVFGHILRCIRQLFMPAAVAAGVLCLLWVLVRWSYITLGPSAPNTALLLCVLALFGVCLLAPPPPAPEKAASSSQKPGPVQPASPLSPVPSQAAEPGSPLTDDGSASAQSALQSDLRPTALRTLPPGIVAPACELPDSTRRIFVLAHSDGWQTVSSSDGILYEAKAIPWAANKAVRFTTTMPCTLTELYDFLTDPDQLLKLDPLMTKMERLSTAEDSAVSLVYNAYSMFKAPVIGVSKRDFVTEISNLFLQATEEGIVRAISREGIDTNEKSMLVQGSCSIEDDLRPATKAAVRGVNYAFGYLVKPNPSGRGVHLIQVMSIDPRGWLPSAAIDASNRVQIDKLLKMQKLLAKPPARQ